MHPIGDDFGCQRSRQTAISFCKPEPADPPAGPTLDALCFHDGICRFFTFVGRRGSDPEFRQQPARPVRIPEQTPVARRRTLDAPAALVGLLLLPVAHDVLGQHAPTLYPVPTTTLRPTLASRANRGQRIQHGKLTGDERNPRSDRKTPQASAQGLATRLLPSHRARTVLRR